MKKYFYSDGTNSLGPFTIEELRGKSITRKTLVWFQGLDEWKQAGEISELSELFKLIPPTITKSNLYFKNMENNTQNHRPPKTWLVESIKWNNCLNRKASICKDGSIRNCPAMAQQFGNIATCDLQHVIKQKTFTKLWNVNKNKITVCHDCEFKYMCHDCRAYITDTNNIYSKPLHCKYNPYETTWS